MRYKRYNLAIWWAVDRAALAMMFAQIVRSYALGVDITEGGRRALMRENYSDLGITRLLRACDDLASGSVADNARS